MPRSLLRSATSRSSRSKPSYTVGSFCSSRILRMVGPYTVQYTRVGMPKVCHTDSAQHPAPVDVADLFEEVGYVVGRAVEAPRFDGAVFCEEGVHDVLGGASPPSQEVRAFEAVREPGKGRTRG